MLREQRASGTNRTRLVDFESPLRGGRVVGVRGQGRRDDDNDEEQLEGRDERSPSFNYRRSSLGH